MLKVLQAMSETSNTEETNSIKRKPSLESLCDPKKLRPNPCSQISNSTLDPSTTTPLRHDQPQAQPLEEQAAVVRSLNKGESFIASPEDYKAKAKGKSKVVVEEEDDDTDDSEGASGDDNVDGDDSDFSDEPLAEVDLNNILSSRTRRRAPQPGAYLVNDLGDDSDDSDDDDEDAGYGIGGDDDDNEDSE